jgi:hypothetical protein
MRTIKKYKKYRGGIHPPGLKPLTKFNPLYPLYNSPETLHVKELSTSSNGSVNDSKTEIKTKKSKTKKSKTKKKSKSLLKKIEERQKQIAWLKMNRFKHLTV